MQCFLVFGYVLWPDNQSNQCLGSLMSSTLSHFYIRPVSVPTSEGAERLLTVCACLP